MHQDRKIFIIGAGAVGLPLAAYLANSGAPVTLLRARPMVAPCGTLEVAIRDGRGECTTAPIHAARLADVRELDGLVVIATKAYANPAIAAELAQKQVSGPLVILQNGLGVERPFLEGAFREVFRCVLYMSSQVDAEYAVTFRQIASCPIGPVRTEGGGLEACVRALTTPQFQFHAEPNIQREAWKKTIINAVFNSICPLLEIDNGVFVRDADIARLAAEVIDECVALAKAHGVPLTEGEVMEQALKISRGSQGVLISTLQDLNHGRETEIESLNLEMARLAATLQPPMTLCKTELLGRMVLAKSRLRRAV